MKNCFIQIILFTFLCVCTSCKSKELKTQFEAKPIGDRELKRWYRENLDNIIGEYGTVKYFNITPDGKPNLPVFLRVRDKKDM